MAARHLAAAMWKRFQGFLGRGVTWRDAAELAGYADSTIRHKGQRFRLEALRVGKEREADRTEAVLRQREQAPRESALQRHCERETPAPPPMTPEMRKQREFQAVCERTAARQASERNTAISMSYVPRFRRLDD